MESIVHLVFSRGKQRCRHRSCQTCLCVLSSSSHKDALRLTVLYKRAGSVFPLSERDLPLASNLNSTSACRLDLQDLLSQSTARCPLQPLGLPSQQHPVQLPGPCPKAALLP